MLSFCPPLWTVSGDKILLVHFLQDNRERVSGHSTVFLRKIRLKVVYTSSNSNSSSSSSNSITRSFVVLVVLVAVVIEVITVVVVIVGTPGYPAGRIHMF